MTKLSIIIPVYNQETLVIRALESIPIRGDIEIIVIDDGSTDDTWNNLLSYRNKMVAYQDIILLYNEENKGVGYTVNRGYDIASGNYILLLGSDDYLITEEVENIIDNELDGTSLIYFNLRINNGDIWVVNDETKRGLCGSVKFMKKSFIGDTRCPEKRCCEDLDFYNKLLEKHPTEKFLNKVVKHYNYPRNGSLTDINMNGGDNNDQL